MRRDGTANVSKRKGFPIWLRSDLHAWNASNAPPPRLGCPKAVIASADTQFQTPSVSSGKFSCVVHASVSMFRPSDKVLVISLV